MTENSSGENSPTETAQAPPETKPTGSPWRCRLSRAATSLYWGSLLTGATGLVLHYTLRDRFALFAWLFYATPLPIVAVLGLLAAAIGTGRRRILGTLAPAVMAVVCLAAWFSQSWYRNPQGQLQGEQLKVLFWNAARPQGRDVQAALAHISRSQADIIGFVESGVHSSKTLRSWQAALPGYTFRRLRGYMLVGVKGSILSSSYSALRQRAWFNLLRVQVRQTTLTLVLVDFRSQPWLSRLPAFQALNQLLSAHYNEPLIVMGDFNTPITSVHFDPWRGHLTHAFESRGQGLIETWPWFIPFLALDHIWVSRSLEVKRCYYGRGSSDHRSVTVVFSPAS